MNQKYNTLRSFAFLLGLLSWGCRETVCPNRIIEEPETCDDGNQINGDGCDSNCTITDCGNGVISGEEQCDDGNQSNTDGCLNTCLLSSCGDGFLQNGQEQCDDANQANGDGCRSDCLGLEVCGDGLLDIATGEQCDDANPVTGDGCRSDCTLELCGDSIVDPQEDCDDGNNVDGDGCGDDCSISVLQVAAGQFHTCALLETGNVRCWGGGSIISFNVNIGQLGYGNTNTIGDDENPASAGDVNVGGVVSQVFTGGQNTCALLSTGNIRCWGRGESGRLGYGNTDNIGDDEIPADAGDINIGGVVSQLSIGDSHTCALLETGTLRCWGFNDSSQLGYDNLESIGDDESPADAGDVNVGGVVTQVTTGQFHTCALLDAGNVRCWGAGVNGTAGYGNTNTIGDDESPADAGDVNIGGVVTQLAAGYLHTCALLSTGNVRCWGKGESGRLGYGNTDNIGDDEIPADAGDVNVGGVVTQIAAGQFHTCALLETGNVRCWGLGDFGQLGYGNTDNIGDDESPASAGDVNVGGVVTQLTVGRKHTCALLSTGDVRCWGFAIDGQLGYGNLDIIGDDESPAAAGDVLVF